MLRTIIEHVGSNNYKISFGFHEGMYSIGLIDKYGVEVYSYSEASFVKCMDRVMDVFSCMISGDIDKVVKQIEKEPLEV